MNRRSVYYADHIGAEFGDGSRPLSDWEARVRARRDLLLSVDWLTDPSTGKRNRPQPVVLSKPYCLYCSGDLVFFGQPNNEPFVGDFSFAGECQRCGWWFCESQHVTYPDGDHSHDDFYEGVLRAFAIDHLDLPLDMLRHYLQRNFEDIRNINPRKFEELCQSVFYDHFACEVRLTGYSRDGGVDLYLVDSEQPCAVQLKRRGGAVTEKVGAVREFLGALVEQGAMRGLFVSTADRFSLGARKAAHSPHLAQLGIKLDLMDYSGLRELFQERSLDNKPWKQVANVREPRLCFSHDERNRPPRFPW